MPTFGDAVITLIATIAMIAAFFTSFIPFVPGTLFMWLITVAYAWVTNFQQLTWLPVIVVTVIMLIGATSDFWLPLIGMKGRGASCSSVLGTIIGGLLGTLLIPLPILGTLIGGVVGAVGLEWLNNRDTSASIRAGTFAAESFALSIILEVILNLIILVIFFAALLIR